MELGENRLWGGGFVVVFVGGVSNSVGGEEFTFWVVSYKKRHGKLNTLVFETAHRATKCTVMIIRWIYHSRRHGHAEPKGRIRGRRPVFAILTQIDITSIRLIPITGKGKFKRRINSGTAQGLP
jgi:hypothetical protein